MMRMDRRALMGLALGAAVTTAATPGLARTRLPVRWMRSWSSAQQIAEPHNALPPDSLTDATLRQLVRLTLGGGRFRVRVSNLFGAEPLVVKGARVARPEALDAPRTLPGSDRPLTFGGRADVSIPAGADYLSDPVDMAVEAFDTLAVSLWLAGSPTLQTSHPGSRATSYVTPGDRTAAPDLPDAMRADHWYFLSGVDVETADAAPGIMVVGDSITDGYGVQPNTNARWTDFLAERLRVEHPDRRGAVLNAGLGGNRIVADGLGPGALARFDRDVLFPPGVGCAVVLIGVNDLGGLSRDPAATPEAHVRLVGAMTGALEQMAARGRDHGVRMIGATITPFGRSEYYHATPDTEGARQAVNGWIRTSGAFDGVIDFDAAMRDPADPTRLNRALDNDGLHPSIEGYRALAAAVDLSLFDA